jgi:pimeloyl-ACP methyl ester carboxylesterase
MATAPASLTLPEIAHHRAHVNGTTLHYVAAGTTGSPVLLVHGFPETWRAFRKLIPLLAAGHRVFAVDLRGFGDSDTAPADYDSWSSAEDLHQPIAHLGLGPVHLTGQDISGTTVFRLAATHPRDMLSLTAIEIRAGVTRGRGRRRPVHGLHHVPGRVVGDQFRPPRWRRPLRRDGGPCGEGGPRLRRRYRRRLGH